MPSKKVISIFILAFGLVTSILLISPKTNSVSQIQKNIEKNIKNSGSLSNGPEVKVSANSSWQKDLENISPLPEASSENQSSSNEAITDQFARSFMANFISLKQTNSLNDESAKTLIDKSIDFIDPVKKPAYTLSSIVVDPSNDLGTIQRYGNSLGELVKLYKPANIGAEVQILTEIARNPEGNNADKQAELKQHAEFYSGAASSISKIAVPSSFTENHLTLINTLNNLSLSIEDMGKFGTDPIVAMKGLGNYTSNLTSVTQIVTAIKDRIVKSGAVYKQGEGGYYLLYGI